MINTNFLSGYKDKHSLNPLKYARRKKKVMISRGIDAHGWYADRISQTDPNVEKEEEEKRNSQHR